MNNKGFTLIELLGTIILISLITMLAVPKILNWYSNSANSYESLNESLIVEAARIYVTEQPNKFKAKEEHTYCITMQNMIDYGCLDEKNVKGLTDKNYSSTFVTVVNNGEYFEYYLTDTCTEK